MTTNTPLDKCSAYVDSQYQDKGRRLEQGLKVSSGPAITISRQTGSGGHTIAEKLASYLDRHGPAGACAWTVFDRQLVAKALEEHHLPKQWARFIPESRRSYLQEVMEELLGLHPSSEALVRQVTETVLHLAEIGHVILVGRGAHVITAKIAASFHVRLVASEERRLERVMEVYRLSAKNALQFMHKEDRGRLRYLQEHFQCRVDDDLLYHLVINTDRISYQEAAELIGWAALRRFEGAGAG